MHLGLQVGVEGVEGDLRAAAERALTIKPNFAYTIKEVQEDLKRVFDSGYFKSVRSDAADTRDGVKLTVQA